MPARRGEQQRSGRGAGRTKYIGHRDGNGLRGIAARVVGGGHRHVVDVVGADIARHLEVWRSDKAQHTRGGVDREARSIGAACNAVDQCIAIGVGRSDGGNRGAVLGHADSGGWTAEIAGDHRRAVGDIEGQRALHGVEIDAAVGSAAIVTHLELERRVGRAGIAVGGHGYQCAGVELRYRDLGRHGDRGAGELHGTRTWHLHQHRGEAVGLARCVAVPEIAAHQGAAAILVDTQRGVGAVRRVVDRRHVEAESVRS